MNTDTTKEATAQGGDPRKLNEAGPSGWEESRREELRRFVALTPTQKLRLLVSMLEFAGLVRASSDGSGRAAVSRESEK